MQMKPKPIDLTMINDVYNVFLKGHTIETDFGIGLWQNARSIILKAFKLLYVQYDEARELYCIFLR